MKPAFAAFFWYCIYTMVSAIAYGSVAHSGAANFAMKENTAYTDTIKKVKKTNANCFLIIVKITGSSCLGSTLSVSANDDIDVVEWRSEYGSMRKESVSAAYDGSYTPTVAATYYALVTTKSGCVEVRSNSVTITDPDLPVVAISASSSVICPAYPNPVFQATQTHGGDHALYQWKVNDVNVGTPTESTSYYSNGLKKNDKVTCEMTSMAPCVTTPTVTSNIITIDDVPVEHPSVTIAPDNPKPCAGSEILFTATPTHAGNAPSFTWFVNGVQVAGTSATYLAVQLKEGDKVSCSVLSSAQACQLATTGSSEDYTVTFTAPVTPEISISASTTTADQGKPITFTASAKNGGLNPEYQWQVNDVDAYTGSATFTTSSLKDGDKVSCMLISDAECTTANTALSDKITVHIIMPVTLFTPNAFTPNGDGVNDTWLIAGIALHPAAKVNVYNRYGQQVFHSTGYTKAWGGDNKGNGSPCAAGVYYYMIMLENNKTLSGAVTILR